MSAHEKLLMIGLDAGDRAFIEQNLASLPNMARFFRETEINLLHAEPMAGAVWGSFVNQSRPDEHGFYHHLQWNPERMRMQRTHPLWIGQSEPFWRRLAKQGRRVTAVDVPFAFSDASNPAFEIGNWGSHDLVEKFWCTNKPEGERLRKTYGLHPMGFEVPVDKTERQLSVMIDDIIRGASLKADLIIDLMNRTSWDLFVTVFGETHRAGHMLWTDGDEHGPPAPSDGLLNVYRAVDGSLGRILSEVGDACHVILFSLHGMGHNHCQNHLARDMLTRALAAAAGAPEPTKAKEQFGLFRVLRKSAPAGLQHAIAERVPAWVRDFVIAREIAGGVDWSNTKAISLNGDLSGYWRFNVEGREAKGCLAPGEYDALCTYLAKTFSEVKNEKGDFLVQKIHFPARDGNGARAKFLPDIVAEWDPSLPPAKKAIHPVLGEIEGKLTTGRGGNHRFNGFYCHRGKRSSDLTKAVHICELGETAAAIIN